MTDLQSLKPKDHAEEVAIFRSEIVGALTRRDLDHGELSIRFHCTTSHKHPLFRFYGVAQPKRVAHP